MRKKEIKLLAVFFAVMMTLYGIGVVCGLDMAAEKTVEAAVQTEEAADTDGNGAMAILAGVVVAAAVLLNQRQD